MSRPSKSRAILCSSCRNLVGANESVCPHCGARQPGMFGLAPWLRKLEKDGPDVVQIVVGTAVVFYVVMLGLSFKLDPAALRNPPSWFALGSPAGKVLYAAGATSGFHLFSGQVWTLITASYLHAGLLHIGFNGMWLVDLGRLARDIWGPARFFVVFTLSGIGGFLLSNVVSGAFTVGASCGLFGLLAAMAVFGWRRGGVAGERIKQTMVRWLIAATVFAFLIGGVNHWGHAGGALTGAALAFALPAHERQHAGRGIQLLAIALAVITVLSWVAVLIKLPANLELVGL